MAIARMDFDVAVQGTPLEVRGADGTSAAIAHTIIFDDPKKTKRNAK